MARVYLTAGNLTLVYTIDQAAGSGCPNKRDDTMLVQFFLKVVSEGPEKAKFTPAGRGPMNTDGIWGPTPQAYLDQFISVNSAQNPGSPLTRDGRSDPVVGGKITGSVSGHIYTILALNTSYRTVRGLAALQDITTDALFPKDPRPSLKINRTFFGGSGGSRQLIGLGPETTSSDNRRHRWDRSDACVAGVMLSPSQTSFDGLPRVGTKLIHRLALCGATGDGRDLGPEPACFRFMDDGLDLHK